MSAVIRPEEWLHSMQREYLSTFILEGGSAIKFVVPLEAGVRAELFDGLAGIGSNAGYLTIQIDAVETKVHMIEELFFRAAAQVPWQALSQEVLARLAADLGYAWTESGEGPLYHRLAAHNQVDPQLLLLDLKRSIGDKVLKQPKLSRDFRVAMTHLCLAELSGGEDGSTTVQVLTDWLTGRNKAVSTIKPYQLFRKINRSTARFFFESMIYWVRFAGYPGTLILLDVERMMLARKPAEPGLFAGVFYSKAAVLDAYEVLRQFIDALDRLEGCFIAVVPDFAFLEDPQRGISAYEALKFRVFDEVRDRSLVNPMASLTRISAGAARSHLNED